MSFRHNIVIAGAGFGGLYALLSFARVLRKDEADITLIDKNDYFLFTPLLHEVATGVLSEKEVTESLLPFVARVGARFMRGEIHSIDTQKKVLQVGEQRVPYDTLIIACGSATNHWSVLGAKEYAFPLKNLEDATRLHTHLVGVFQKASMETNVETRKKLLRFVIVGGGATGVELAGEMKDFATDALQAYPTLRAEEMEFVLAHSGSELLVGFHPRLREWALESLQKDGWKVFFSKNVSEVRSAGVVFSDGSFLDTATVVWVAGVKADVPSSVLPFSLLSTGRLKVNHFLQVEGYPDIFAIGDDAGYAEMGNGWPMLAQAAVQGGKVAAKNIVNGLHGKPLKRFSYQSKGSLVSLGHWKAIGEIGGVPIRGWWVWILWQMVYLTKFVSWKKRMYMVWHWLTHIGKKGFRA